MKKILLVDDDPIIHSVVRRVLCPPQHLLSVFWNGEEALLVARVETPDLVLLDLNLPTLSGWAMAQAIRQNASTRLTPIIMLSGTGGLADKVEGLTLGADDYLTKPFAPAELKARVDRLLSRHSQDLSANPLTLLPGAPTIELEVMRRADKGEPLALLYIDIDRFKAYNDAYGYHRGDAVLLKTAQILSSAVERHGKGEGFLGHIGGDDFVILTSPQNAEDLSRDIAFYYDQAVHDFYDFQDARRGFVETITRRGERELAPLMSLSIAIVSNEGRPLSHYAEIADAAAGIKRCLKLRSTTGSAWMKDRRRPITPSRPPAPQGLPAAF